jgi:hypothetical protein
MSLVYKQKARLWYQIQMALGERPYRPNVTMFQALPKDFYR